MQLRTIIAVFFFFSAPLYLPASDATRQEYLQLVEAHPSIVTPLGDSTNGEIEIILDPVQMEAIESKTGRAVGVLQRDRYFIWLNDACRFPNGREGVYGRVIWTSSLWGFTGVAVMPVLPDGRIAVNCNFRHATRSWEIELPRGGLERAETPEQGAKRETLEETGLVVDDLSLIGYMPPDTGFSNTVVPIFKATVLEKQAAHQEDSEAIEEILFFTPTELKLALRNGYYDHCIRGEITRVNCRDPFLTFALLNTNL